MSYEIITEKLLSSKAGSELSTVIYYLFVHLHGLSRLVFLPVSVIKMIQPGIPLPRAVISPYAGTGWGPGPWTGTSCHVVWLPLGLA